MTDVLIVGAGPAGIRAAEALVKAGVKPVVVDEGMRAGGQIYRRPPAGFTRSGEQLYGREAAKAQALHACFDQLVAQQQLSYLPQSSVVALHKGSAHVLTPDGLRHLPYDRLLLATGATDRLAPVPGWQSAGVYSLGATQIALKSQGVAMGRRIVLAGSGPLLTLVAVQLIKAGASVAAVLDTASLRDQLFGGVQMAVARPWVTLHGMRMRAQLGRIYHAGVSGLRIETDATGPTQVRWRDRRGQARETDCDTVGLGWHVMADTPLSELAGATLGWSDIWAQFLPVSDRFGRAGEGLYLAGDGLQILGADGAEIAGRLAAVACLTDMGIAAQVSPTDLRDLARMRRFAKGVARAFPWPQRQMDSLPAETIVCRCEGVTAADIRAATQQVGPEINRVKSQCRAGMGRCQGRYCQRATQSVIAAQSGTTPDAVGRLRAQPPVRPLPISALLKQ